MIIIPSTSSNSVVEDEDGSVELLQLASVFLAEWRTGAITFLVLFLVGTIITFTMKPLFEATATIYPQDRPSESNNLAAIFSAKSSADIYLGLLASRTVADRVINRVNLLDVFHTKSYDKARNLLAAGSKFSIRKDSLVGIEIRNADGTLATSIVNAYIDALQEQQEGMAVEQASARRRIFEKQVEEERSALSIAEQDLKTEQEKSGLVQPESQTQIGLGAIASVRAQVTTMQVQLAGLLQSSTEENPKVRTLRSQIGQLEAQLRSLESGSRGGVGASLPGGKMPEANLEYARKLREVKYHEALLNALGSQYESAKLSEVQTVSQFQVVDRAVVPERKSWPPRTLFLVLSLVVGILFGAILMVLRLMARRLWADPLQRQYLQAIRNSFRLAR